VRAAALLLAAGLATPGSAQQECRLALLLGMDVSASVDAAEYQLQIEGLAAALIHPSVVEAALSAPAPWRSRSTNGRGASSRMCCRLDLIQSEADLTSIAERVLRATRNHEDFPTALGYALGFAATHLNRAPPCLFRTVDISGDGQNNDGFPPPRPMSTSRFEGVTVNGLAIGGASRGIEDYYLAEVIHGPGAFVEYARNHEDFEEVMRRKLERELRVVILGELAE
jgi:hypothetical protein